MFDLYTSISVYAHVRDHKGTMMSFANFINMGKKYIPQIKEYRAMKQAIADKADVCDALDSELVRLKKRADEMKRSFPAATMSGAFAPTRAKCNLQKHSGFMCIDIDDHYQVEGSDGVTRSYSQPLDGVRDILEQLPYVMYAGNSVGGKGFFVLIPLARLSNDGVASDDNLRNAITAEHEWYFSCLEEEFSQMGIIIDKACSDTTRLRILSYTEPDMVLRRRPCDVVPYAGVAGFVSKNERRRQAEQAARISISSKLNDLPSGDMLRAVVSCIEEVERRGCDITGANYQECLSLGMAFHSLDSTLGLDLWKRLCRFRSPSLHSHFVTDGEIESTWRRISATSSPKRPDIRTILYALSNRVNPPILIKDFITK